MEIVEQFRLSTFCCICKQICSRGRERTTNSGRLEGSIILQVVFFANHYAIKFGSFCLTIQKVVSGDNTLNKTNHTHQVQRHEKLRHKLVFVFHFVSGNLCLWKDVNEYARLDLE